METETSIVSRLFGRVDESSAECANRCIKAVKTVTLDLHSLILPSMNIRFRLLYILCPKYVVKKPSSE